MSYAIAKSAPAVLRPERGRGFNVEYADVLGIPFDFAAQAVLPNPAKPRETIRVHAASPDRDALAITFRHSFPEDP